MINLKVKKNIDNNGQSAAKTLSHKDMSKVQRLEGNFVDSSESKRATSLIKDEDIVSSLSKDKVIKKYYVYIYLDPRKKGSYQYGKHSFMFQPFYVGKGYKNRIKSLLLESQRTKQNQPKYKKVNSILSEGLEPIMLKVKENLTEASAFRFEKYLINLIGRKCDKGTLTNILIGGEGASRPGQTNGMYGKGHLIKGSKNGLYGVKGESHHAYGKPGYWTGRETWNKGKTGIYSEETLKKMSDARKGTVGYWKDKKLPKTTTSNKVRNYLNSLGRKITSIEYDNFVDSKRCGYPKFRNFNKYFTQDEINTFLLI